MLSYVPYGKHTLEVNVKDNVRTRDRDVTSTVTITIEELPEEAPYKSGSVRLKGRHAESDVIYCSNIVVLVSNEFFLCPAKKWQGTFSVCFVGPSFIPSFRPIKFVFSTPPTPLHGFE